MAYEKVNNSLVNEPTTDDVPAPPTKQSKQDISTADMKSTAHAAPQPALHNELNRHLAAVKPMTH